MWYQISAISDIRYLQKMSKLERFSKTSYIYQPYGPPDLLAWWILQHSYQKWKQLETWLETFSERLQWSLRCAGRIGMINSHFWLTDDSLSSDWWFRELLSKSARRSPNRHPVGRRKSPAINLSPLSSSVPNPHTPTLIIPLPVKWRFGDRLSDFERSYR